MKHKTIKACHDCGKKFQGSPDMHYCPDCARKRKSNSVIRFRTCIDCGVQFSGGPKAVRCPVCATRAAAEQRAAYKKQHKPVRPLGSIDQCEWCGKDYVVRSGKQKYCSPECMKKAVLVWQREHKKGYHIESGQNMKKQERRLEQEKICVYCGRRFKTRTTSNLCSDYCRVEQKKIKICEIDIKRGKNRNLQKYIDKRNEYREKVKEEVENDLQTV